MFKEINFCVVLKLIMLIYYPLLFITLFAVLCSFSYTKKQEHKRLSGIRDEIYVPSLINFELKGKSLAWIPVRLAGSNIQPSNKQVLLKKNRKPRYVEEESWNNTSSPRKIYNAQRDVDDSDLGTGENNGSFDGAEPFNDYEIDTKLPEVFKSTLLRSVQTQSDILNETKSLVDASTKTTQLLFSATEGPLTDDTEEDPISIMLGTEGCFIKEHRHSSNISTERVTTEKTTVDHTLKMEGKEEYWEKDEEREKNTPRKETVHGLFTTRLVHIETPPRPQRPLNLSFPTCSGSYDFLEIEPPVFRTYPTHPPTGRKGKKKKNYQTHLRRTTHHTTRQIVTTISTVVIESNKKKPEKTQAIPTKKYQGHARKDAQVLVRIPPSLSELPVLVLRDPESKILSLSVVDSEQQTFKPYSSQHNLVYYPQQPFSYQQILPPPLSYNNIYFPNYPSMNKMYPYWYMYGPNIMNNRETYMIPNKQKYRDYINNIRSIRDTYYEDEGDEKNFTKSD